MFTCHYSPHSPTPTPYQMVEGPEGHLCTDNMAIPSTEITWWAPASSRLACLGPLCILHLQIFGSPTHLLACCRLSSLPSSYCLLYPKLRLMKRHLFAAVSKSFPAAAFSLAPPFFSLLLWNKQQGEKRETMQ